jgi:hypothetical protein
MHDIMVFDPMQFGTELWDSQKICRLHFHDILKKMQQFRGNQPHLFTTLHGLTTGVQSAGWDTRYSDSRFQWSYSVHLRHV